MNLLNPIPKDQRDRLYAVVLVTGLCFALSLIFIDPLLLLLEHPLPSTHADLTFLSPNEPAWISVKVAFMATLFLAMPVILYGIWGFIVPGFKGKTNRATVLFIGLGSLSFWLGGVFCYFLVLPLTFKFLLGWGVQYWKMQVTMAFYYSIVVNMMLAFAYAFLTPLVMVLLVMQGRVKAVRLRKIRPWAYCACFVIAAILTPPDIITQILLAVPLYCLYEFGVVASTFFENTRNGSPGIQSF